MQSMTRLLPKGPRSTLTQTVGAAVLKFTIAKWFVFSTSTSWGGKDRWDVMTVRLSLAYFLNSGAVLKAHAGTWSMSPRCPWISWDRSRSRVTGLLHKTWRLKSKFIKPLQNEASSTSRKERKLRCYNLVSLLEGWGASLEHIASHVSGVRPLCCAVSTSPQEGRHFPLLLSLSLQH